MPADLSGQWRNQHGSTMSLLIDAEGKVSGTYQTAVGSPDPTYQFAIRGFVLDDVIAFTVRWSNASGNYHSLTSWAGQMTLGSSNEDVIQTLWHLAADVPDPNEPATLWKAIWAGADDFRRTTTVAPPTPINFANRPSFPLSLIPKKPK